MNGLGGIVVLPPTFRTQINGSLPYSYLLMIASASWPYSITPVRYTPVINVVPPQAISVS